MYLQKLRELQAGPGNWPTDCTLEPAELDRLLDVADATLNSWKEAHEVFDFVKREGVSPKAMMCMKIMLKDALRCEPAVLNNYTAEVLTFALLRSWFATHQEELQHASKNPA